MQTTWKKLRYRFERIALGAAAWLVPKLSRRCCYELARFFGGVASELDRSGRRVALSNLEVAFGSEISPERRRVIVRESYQNFVQTMIDLLWTARVTPENFRRWFDVHNLDEVMAAIGPSRSCIFTTIHYGNFEWAARAMGLSGHPLLILAQEFKNPSLDPIFEQLRRDAGHEVAGRGGAIAKLYKALKRGRHVAILSDLTLKHTEPSAVIDCFGLKTCVTYAHAWLHRRTGAPIVPLHCEPLPDGRYALYVQRPLVITPDATDAQIAQLCWDRFEEVVRQNPSPWLWMYKHWRYDLPGSKKPYPFYANIGPKFEARLFDSGALETQRQKP